MTFKASGFRELLADLEKLDSVRREEGALKRAMMASLGPTADLARALVPVRTGKLRRSIITSDRRQFQPKKQRGEVSVFLGTSYQRGANGRHGHLVEFGTVKARPHPFLRPAWDQDGRDLLVRLSDELSKQIKAALRRQGR